MLDRNKIDKTYSNVNFFNNDAKVLICRMDNPKKNAYITWTDYNVLNWSKYQIKESDMRQKTASFTSNTNIDLTTGLYCVLICSQVHENFAGVIIKKTYNEDTGLYDYQCQDWSRLYQAKIEFKVVNDTVYKVLQSLITLNQIELGKKVTKKMLKYNKYALSGLMPSYLYDPIAWKNGKTSNPMKVKKNMIIRDKTYMEAIRDIVFGTGEYIDVYFTDNGVLHIEPFNRDDWLSGGLVLTTSEIMNREFTFDTTNIITGVRINGNDLNMGYSLNSENLTKLDLSAFFGNLGASLNKKENEEEKTNKNVGKTQSSDSNNKIGKGTHVFMNTDTINGYSSDKRLMNEIAKYLRKKGYSVTVGGVGPSTHYNDITKVKKNGIYFTLYGGRCAGTLKEQCYSSHYHSILKKRNAKMVVGFYRRKLTDAYLPRAHDDNFSPSSFRGWSKPKTHLLNNGVGVVNGNSAKEIANAFPGFKNTTTTKKVVTKKSNNTKTYKLNVDFNNIQMERAEALEKVDASIRDLMNVKITLPLGNPILKKLHTNMFIWTMLPSEFKVANFKEIATALNSKYNRYSGYELNRWYVESLTINNNGGNGTIEVSVNPFASSISKYRDNRLKYEEAYRKAIESTNNKTTNNNTNNKKTKLISKSKLSINDAVREVGKLTEGKKYSHAYQSASAFRKYGKGDCWACSYFIACELKKRGVTARIIQYPTSMSSAHRSVQYKNGKGSWVNFPYRSYKIHSWFRNTRSSGTVIPIKCG